MCSIGLRIASLVLMVLVGLSSRALAAEWAREGNAVRGNVLVEETEDLEALAGVTSISGYLVIENVDVADLTPLRALENVGGNLIIFGNPGLVTLDALSNLRTVGGNVSIGSNPRLTRVSLDKLEVINGFLTITGNPSLTGLVPRVRRIGLSQVTRRYRAHGYLQISGNARLADETAQEFGRHCSVDAGMGKINIRDNQAPEQLSRAR